MYFVVIKSCLVHIYNNGVTAPRMSQGVSKCNVSNRGIAHRVKYLMTSVIFLHLFIQLSTTLLVKLCHL